MPVLTFASVNWSVEPKNACKHDEHEKIIIYYHYAVVAIQDSDTVTEKLAMFPSTQPSWHRSRSKQTENPFMNRCKVVGSSLGSQPIHIREA